MKELFWIAAIRHGGKPRGTPHSNVAGPIDLAQAMLSDAELELVSGGSGINSIYIAETISGRRIQKFVQ
jgi:hypothetical protein